MKGKTMTVQVNVDDMFQYGAVKAILLGYLRENPKQTKEEIMKGLRLTEEPVRRHLEDLEVMGVLKRQYKQGRHGRPSIIGVKFL